MHVEAPVSEPAPQVAAREPSASAVPASSGISFKNGRAVMVTIGVAIATLVLTSISFAVAPAILGFAVPLLIAGGGFFAAVLYARQTKTELSNGAGARLGWMTGVWFMLVILVFTTIGVVLYTGPSGAELVQKLQATPQYANMKLPDPKDIASIILAGVVQMFFVSVVLFVFGGIVGARFASRSRRSA